MIRSIRIITSDGESFFHENILIKMNYEWLAIFKNNELTAEYHLEDLLAIAILP